MSSSSPPGDKGREGPGDDTNRSQRSMSFASAVSGSTTSAGGGSGVRKDKSPPQSRPAIGISNQFPTPTGTPKSSGTPGSISRRQSTASATTFLGIKRQEKRPSDMPLLPHQPRSRMDSPRLSLASPRAFNPMDVVRADEVSLPTMLPPSDGSGSPMLSPRIRSNLPPKTNSRMAASMSPPPARLPLSARSPRCRSPSLVSSRGNSREMSMMDVAPERSRTRSPLGAPLRGGTPTRLMTSQPTPGFFSTAATSGNASSRAPSSCGSPVHKPLSPSSKPVPVSHRPLGETVAGRWHVVGSVQILETEGRIHATMKDRHVTILWHKGNVTCIDSICAHAGGPLGLGDIEDVALPDGRQVSCILCPWHSYHVALSDGSKYVQKIEFDPATQKPKDCPGGNVGYQQVKGNFQRTHNVRIDGDDVLVELSTVKDKFQSDRYATGECKRVGDAAFENVLRGENSRDLDSKLGSGALSSADTRPGADSSSAPSRLNTVEENM